jgi:hypothetical protein
MIAESRRQRLDAEEARQSGEDPEAARKRLEAEAKQREEERRKKKSESQSFWSEMIGRFL